MTRTSIAILCAALVLGACDPHKHAQDDHKKDAVPGVALTQYNEATQLYVEFPSLVKGSEASFAAHVTRLADFKPVADGRIRVTLTGGGVPDESAEASVSKTPGIFKPALTPQHAGKRHLVFTLQAAGIDSRHDLGEVVVYPDVRSAMASATEEPPAGIRFAKEQQWQMDWGTSPVSTRPLRESVAATATIRPRASGEAQLASPAPGVLRAGAGGFPQVGMKVARGQTVAFVVPRLGGETDVASLTLDVERATAEAQLAQDERTRLERLLEAEAVPEKRVNDARSRERVALAQLKAARARAAAYQGGAGGIALKSPVAGTIVAVNGAPGAPVTEGQFIVHVAELSRLWLEARIAENDVPKLRNPGGAFFMVGDDPVSLDVGKNAQLVAAGGLIDKESRTAPVIFEFENPQGRLRAGMTVRAAVYTGAESRSIAVPVAAVVDDNGQPVVFVEKAGETFERRVVQSGVRDGSWIAITSGLREGERLVTRGAWQVRLAAISPAALGEGHSH